MAKRYSIQGRPQKARLFALISYAFTFSYKYKDTMYFVFCVVLKISILKNMPTKLYPQTKLKLKCISLLSGFLWFLDLGSWI